MKLAFPGLVAVALVCALLPGGAAAQQFPRLQEENLSGQQVVLPDAASGKIAVLVMGFSKASKTPTEAWARRIDTDFGKTPGFVLYQMPILEDVPKMFRGMIISASKKVCPRTSARASFRSCTMKTT
jgi:hypothetical protein